MNYQNVPTISAAKIEMIKRQRDEIQANAAKPHNIPYLERQHKKEADVSAYRFNNYSP